jgi:hypothetical protein
LFSAVADEFLAFVGDALRPSARSMPWCWLGAKHSGGHNTLDDLCSRYGANSLRSKHGALLDAELLAAVYIELTTTRQAALQPDPIVVAPLKIHAIVRSRPHPLPPRVSADGRNVHRAFVRTLGTDARFGLTISRVFQMKLVPARPDMMLQWKGSNFASSDEINDKLMKAIVIFPHLVCLAFIGYLCMFYQGGSDETRLPQNVWPKSLIRRRR